MKPISFPEQNAVFAKNQPQYLPLPSYKFPKSDEGRIAFVWKMDWRERLKVLFTGKIWHEVLTFNHPLQPQKVSVVKPSMK